MFDETLAGEPHRPGETAVERELAVGDELDVALTRLPRRAARWSGAQRPQRHYDVELADTSSMSDS